MDSHTPSGQSDRSAVYQKGTLKNVTPESGATALPPYLLSLRKVLQSVGGVDKTYLFRPSEITVVPLLTAEQRGVQRWRVVFDLIKLMAENDKDDDRERNAVVLGAELRITVKGYGKQKLCSRLSRIEEEPDSGNLHVVDTVNLLNTNQKFVDLDVLNSSIRKLPTEANKVEEVVQKGKIKKFSFELFCFCRVETTFKIQI